MRTKLPEGNLITIATSLLLKFIKSSQQSGTNFSSQLPIVSSFPLKKKKIRFSIRKNAKLFDRFYGYIYKLTKFVVALNTGH